MPTIILSTTIKADINTCFDLSRSIDLHKLSTAKTNEEAIAGRTSGLIELNEFVTWRATHLGIRQQLTSKITEYNRPFHFRDVQAKGIFKYFTHDHNFEQREDHVLMTDRFEFKSPGWILGRFVDFIFLKNYLNGFLIERNNVVKDFAEGEKWKGLL